MENEMFVETVRVKDGAFRFPEVHFRRMQETALEMWGHGPDFSFRDGDIPEEMRTGTVKCRILYGEGVGKVEFVRYRPRRVRTLRLVDGGQLDYHLKYADRSGIEKLVEQKDFCDDILIVRDGCICDTGYANVVLYDGCGYYTPDTYLLNGTCRQRLLAEGRIGERRIRPADLFNYSSLFLINAMLDIESGIEVDICDIY